MRQHRCHGAELQFDASGEGVDNRLRRTLVGNRRELGAGQVGQQFPAQARHAGVADGGVADLPRFCFGNGDQFLQVRGGYARVHGEDVGQVAEHGDRRKILFRVIAEVRVQGF